MAGTDPEAIAPPATAGNPARTALESGSSRAQAALEDKVPSLPHASRPFRVASRVGTKNCVPVEMLHAVLSHTWHGSSQASSQPTEPSNGPTPFDYTTPFEDFCTYATSKAIKALHRYTTQLARATKGSPPPLVLPLRNRQFSVPDPIAAKLWSKAEVMCSVLLVACQLTDTDAEWCSLPWLKAVTVPPEAQGSRIALWLYLCTHIQPRISVLEISAIYNDVRNLWILTISPLSVTLSPAAAARIATNEAAARGFPVNSPSQVEYWVGQVCGYCAAYVSQSTGASWYLRAYGSPMPGTPLVRHCSLGLCKRKHSKSMSAEAWRLMQSVKVGRADFDDCGCSVYPAECTKVPMPDWVVTVFDNPVMQGVCEVLHCLCCCCR